MSVSSRNTAAEDYRASAAARESRTAPAGAQRMAGQYDMARSLSLSNEAKEAEIASLLSELHQLQLAAAALGSSALFADDDVRRHSRPAGSFSRSPPPLTRVFLAACAGRDGGSRHHGWWGHPRAWRRQLSLLALEYLACLAAFVTQEIRYTAISSLV